MRFLTRHLFNELQRSAVPSASAGTERGGSGSEWEAAVNAYREYLHSIRCTLPESAVQLAETSLHDYRIVEASGSEAEVRLLVGSPWRKPRFSSGLLLKFADVTHTSARSEMQGQDIVAHEILLLDRGVIEFSALLDQVEFFIDFGNVSIAKWGPDSGETNRY